MGQFLADVSDDQSGIFESAAGQWFAMDLSFLSLWLAAAESETQAVFSVGLSFDNTYLFGRGYLFGSIAGRYRLWGALVDGGAAVEGESSDQPSGGGGDPEGTDDGASDGMESATEAPGDAPVGGTQMGAETGETPGDAPTDGAGQPPDSTDGASGQVDSERPSTTTGPVNEIADPAVSAGDEQPNPPSGT